MPLNLIKDPWLPVRREDGTVERIAPYQIAETENPAIAIETGRPDFDGSLIQFLIGLLQTAAAPESHDQWIDWLESPPDPESLQAELLQFADAFNLDGEGPRFMQDFDKLESKPWKIGWLLVDGTGKNTEELNIDHFKKRDSITQICPACMASALYTLQSNAPGGGQGHMTSIRGGGPLTTIVSMDPDTGTPALWSNIWLNVLDQTQAINLNGDHRKTGVSDIFPWMAHTRISGRNGVTTTPEDASPFQHYWGMPRRISISWKQNNSGYCDLCGDSSQNLVSEYMTQPKGVDYEGAWEHPLSPYYFKDNKTGWLASLTQQGGITYQHWLGMILEIDGKLMPARIVRMFSKRRKMTNERVLIHAFGFDTDKGKARCWYESIFPIYDIPKEHVDYLANRIERMINASNYVAGVLKKKIGQAVIPEPKSPKQKTEHRKKLNKSLMNIDSSFFEITEQDFFILVKQLIDKGDAKGRDDELLEKWLSIIRLSALKLFDYWSTNTNFSYEDPKRIAKAHDELGSQLRATFIRENILKLSKEKKSA